MREQSYEEMAHEVDDRMARGEEFEDLVPVKAKLAKNPRAVFSVRLSPAELIEITKAARKRGTAVSNFMRLASLAAAREEIDVDVAAEEIGLDELRTRLNAASESISKRLSRAATTRPA